MISHEYQCIYIHIPKTAGSSVEKKLGLFDEIYYGAQGHRSVKGLIDAQRAGKISEHILVDYYYVYDSKKPLGASLFLV